MLETGCRLGTGRLASWRAKGGMRTLVLVICGWRGFCEGHEPPPSGAVQNDLAVLDAMQGKFEEACEQWRGVVEADEACLPARLNFGLIRAEMSWSPAHGNSKHEIRNPNGERE